MKCETISWRDMPEAWKDKILDYEIEIIHLTIVDRRRLPWKDKILDYEIEMTSRSGRWCVRTILKR